MKSILNYTSLVLITGLFFYVACKKDYSCENCGGNPPGGTNKSPIANAGPDQTILLPTDSATLDGSSSSDLDGTISNFQWTKISGPASFAFNSAVTARTVVKSLAAGVYQFELKVTDNGGLSAKDTMRVIVNDPAQPNRPPVAIAGADQTITLPTNTVNLDGSGSTDPDNNIISYAWTKLSGPSLYIIANANAVQTPVQNLVQSTYQFELKVTDAGGLFSKDTVKVTVKDAATVCGQLVAIGHLSIPREYVCAATAGNKVLFAGGATQTSPSVIASSRVDIYDLITQSWSTAELSMPRLALVSVTLGNKIYFTDGFYNASSRVDIYDAANNAWSTAELNTARAGLASGSAGNKIVFAGGYTPYGNKIDILDVSVISWSTAILNEPRTEISASSIGNKVYFSGGLLPSGFLNISDRVDIYDASTNQWSAITMTEPRVGHISVGADDKMFWAGGVSSFDPNGDPINNSSVEIYDVNNGTRTYHQLSQSPFNAAIMNNKIIFLPIVSYYSNSLIHLVDVYDINTHAWSVCNISSLIPVDVAWHESAVGAGNKIYMSEGINPSNQSRVWKLEF